LRWKMLLNLLLLSEGGILSGKEEILFHRRLQINKPRDQDKQRRRDREHLPMRVSFDEFPDKVWVLHFRGQRLHNCIDARCRSSGNVAEIKLKNFYRTLRQRLHKRPTIGLGHDPVVQDHHDAAVGFRADQTTDALSKFQDRFRQ
jgi:hypothetical protein